MGAEHRLTEPERGQQGRPRASVIVCTRERPQDLTRCLQSVVWQRSLFPFETIVVDNNPVTNKTAAVVSGFGSKVRYVVEPRKGLDFARNRGVRESAAPFVAFLDDDAVAHPEWISSILRPFSDPAVACVTGLNKPLELETEAQRLFETHQSLGRGNQPRVFDKSCSSWFFPLGSGVVGAGCNSAFRKEALEKIGMFEESLDVGSPARGGGDLYVFYRLIRAGYKIAYDPSAVAYHRHRRTMPELRKAMFDYGAGHNAYQTRCLLTDRDPAAVVFPALWLMRYHMKELAKSLLGLSNMPVTFALAHTVGYLIGPVAYAMSVAATWRRRNLWHGGNTA